jgi:hypothetical protein
MKRSHILLGVVGTVGIVMFCLVVHRQVSGPLPFDPEIWQAHSAEAYGDRRHTLAAVWTPRRRMVQDLLDNHVVSGLTTTGLCELLGPDQNAQCGRGGDPAGLEPHRPFWINDSALSAIGLWPGGHSHLACFINSDHSVRGCGIWTGD